MNIAEVCIRRPVMTTLVMAAFVVFGMLSYFKLPVSELPAVDFPTISVTATLPGASPETMAASVATPLEGQFSTIAGLDAMSSVSAQGRTNVTLSFALDRDIDAAAADVQAAISGALRRLPPDMPTPPSYRKVNPADSPIFYIAMSSDTLPLAVVNEYAETQLAQRLSTVSGVAQVVVYGSQRFAVRVRVDPTKLAARGIGIDEVQQAIAQNNVNKPTGELEGSRQALAVRSNGQLERSEAFRDLTVVYRNGAPVKLRDVADVIDSVESLKAASWFNGRQSIVLAVQRQPGTNTIATVEAIRKELPGFQARLPGAVNLEVFYDRTQSIRASVNDVKKTLIEAGVLVVLVIFLFLRNVSATLIPSVALPISLVGTFALMFALGYSLDNLSLLALTLAVGFVVDDAIVMLENIVRHMEMGKSPHQASLDGSKEIGFTIVSMTLALVAVFIPVMFMGGIVGRLLHEFAFTISVAILASAVVSLTLTPMLCSRYLRHDHDKKPGLVFRVFEAGFEGLRSLYRVTLDLALRFRAVVLLIFFVTTALTGWLYTQVPKEFLPSGDTGQIIAFTEGAQDSSFAAMAERQARVAEIIARDENVLALNSSVGAGGPRATSNNGSIFIRLKPSDERKAKPAEIIQQLRRKTAGVPGIRLSFQNPPPIRIGGMLTQGQYQYTLQGGDLAELYDWSNQLLARLRRETMLQDVNTNLNVGSPTVTLDIDRERLGQLGLTMGQVQEALTSAFSSRQVSTIYGAAAQYQVILEVSPEFQGSPAALSKLYVRSAQGGRLVPLESVASFRRSSQALTVNHKGQLPSVTLSFNLPPGVALGQAVDRVGQIEREMQMPASVSGAFSGQAQAFQESLQGLGILLLVAVLVIYIVLGILYESFIHPLTILSGLPSAGLGALLTLLVFKIDLSLYAFVGIIMLIGIVKKNAIMMIDFALDSERKRGIAPFEAIREACLVRFRPIMMTTMAALAGTLPIALGTGAGGETRVPLGMAVVGGLIVSQILTLYLTPVIYLYLHRLSTWLARPPRTTEAAAGAPSHVSPAVAERHAPAAAGGD